MLNNNPIPPASHEFRGEQSMQARVYTFSRGVNALRASVFYQFPDIDKPEPVAPVQLVETQSPAPTEQPVPAAAIEARTPRLQLVAEPVQGVTSEEQDRQARIAEWTEIANQEASRHERAA